MRVAQESALIAKDAEDASALRAQVNTVLPRVQVAGVSYLLYLRPLFNRMVSTLT